MFRPPASPSFPIPSWRAWFSDPVRFDWPLGCLV
jgi:hypothetical protein